MSRPDILPDGSTKSILVVGHFPSKLNPSIPKTLLANDGGKIVVLGQDWSSRPASDNERESAISTNIVVDANRWVAVIDGQPVPMLLEDLMRWRHQKAVQLVQDAMAVRGDPMKVLNMLESAAGLRSLDLAGFVSALRTQCADDGEDLGSAFLRARGNRRGGQTNE